MWVIDTAAETVVVYESLLAPRTLTAGETLTGGNVVPGFSTGVAELFEV